ncbi:MAG: hypothetical protein CFE45_12945, partial [Burkholderiales bacterium PBB5]
MDGPLRRSLRRTTAVAKALVLAALAWSHPGAQAAADVDSLLRDADRFRSAEHQQVDTQVTTLNRDGSVDKERRYTVFTAPQHQSLVLMRSPAEA